MRKDYNNGEPERRGDERNYQKYLDRVAEMKAAIARKESDIAALQARTGQAAAVRPAASPAVARRARGRRRDRLRGLRPPGHDGGGGHARRPLRVRQRLVRERARPVAPQRAARLAVRLVRRGRHAARHRGRRGAQRVLHQPLRGAAAPARARPAATRCRCTRSSTRWTARRTCCVELVEIEQQTRQDREERALGQAQANKELIRNLAHEIKNPLGGIRGAAQLLEMEVEITRADRVHAGHHQRGRPAAGAGRPAARAAPQAARGQRRQHPRGLRAGALADPGRVPARAAGASATTTSRSPTSAATASS